MSRAMKATYATCHSLDPFLNFLHLAIRSFNIFNSTTNIVVVKYALTAYDRKPVHKFSYKST